MDYRNLRQSPLTKDKKGLDWITLSRICLKSECPSAMHDSGISRTVRRPERRDRIKASVLLNGSHFEC